MTSSNSNKTIDGYIETFLPSTKILLKKMRETIRECAPEASETISYGIPTFKLNGNLVHFAAYKNHIGFYPGTEAIHVFAKDLESYATSKGTVQFPIDKPLPLELVKKITRFRVQKNTEKKK